MSYTSSKSMGIIAEGKHLTFESSTLRGNPKHLINSFIKILRFGEATWGM